MRDDPRRPHSRLNPRENAEQEFQLLQRQVISTAKMAQFEVIQGTNEKRVIVQKRRLPPKGKAARPVRPPRNEEERLRRLVAGCTPEERLRRLMKYARENGVL